LTNQAEQSARPLPSGIVWRARQAMLRGLRELAARLWTSLWQIVIVAVIMASLVALGDLSLGLALTAFVSFVASVALLPRQEVDPVLEDELGHSVSSVRSISAMHVLAEALPDPVILLNRAGQVLYCNAPARSLFASLRPSPVRRQEYRAGWRSCHQHCRDRLLPSAWQAHQGPASEG
jgi:PAS domain-containing protein